MYYNTLHEATKQALFAAMRKLGEQQDAYWSRARDLTPPAGTVRIGGADFDEVLRAEIIGSYLRAIRKGATPKEALAFTESDRTAYVQSWNRKNDDYVTHRSLTAEQTFIEDVHRTILEACK